jgi:hypothetical protein
MVAQLMKMRVVGNDGDHDVGDGRDPGQRLRRRGAEFGGEVARASRFDVADGRDRVAGLVQPPRDVGAHAADADDADARPGGADGRVGHARRVRRR